MLFKRIALAALMSFTAAAAELEKLALDDLVGQGGGGRGGALALSPDGKKFASIERGQIVLIPAEGGPSTPVTASPEPKSEVSWSPDGKKLAYVSNGDVWVVSALGSAAGKDAKRLTSGAVGQGDPRGATDHFPKWNPKGKWILFQSGRRGQNELYVVPDSGGQPVFLAATEIYDGRDKLPPPSHDTGDAVSVDRFDPNPEWSPDGSRIVYTERSRKFFSGKLNLLAFDQETGHAKDSPATLYTAAKDPGGAWAINTAAWAPDGQRLAVVLQESGWDKIYLLPAAGGKLKPLTKGDSEDEDPVYSPDGKWIAFVSNRGVAEERHIWLVAAGGGQPKQLAKLGPGVESGPRWSADGSQIYFSRSSPFEPGSRYVAEVATGSAKLFGKSTPSKFASAGVASPRVVHFKSANGGLQIAGVLYEPAGFVRGKRYPAVVWAHGGPEGQDALTFAPWPLYLAQQGYLVLLPNFRGSTGYGEKFRNANVEDSGGGEIDDVVAGVKYLVDEGLADAKRVAIGGGSHGGTVVANAVTKSPDTFAAAIQLYGVTDRATFLERTNRNSKIRWETKMGGTPEEKPAVYRKANVIPDVARIKTPLLVMHGEEDPQVPPRESAQFVEALKKEGKTYTYFTYPHEGHGFQNREHRLDAYQKQLDFLNKYLQPGDH